MDSQPGSISAEELLAEAGFLQRLARELVADAHDAADLAQETLATALEHPPRRTGPIRGWLATVAANLARNARRAERRRGERERRAAREERVESDELSLERLETQRMLFEAVLALPDEQRTVLYLRYYEELGPSAIAARLGVPLKTIKTRHTRALAVLRERLDVRSRGDRTAWVSALLPLSISRGSAAGAFTKTLGRLAVKKVGVVVAVAMLALLVWWAVDGSGLGARFSASRGNHPVVGAALATQPAKPAPALAPEVLEQRRPSEPVTTASGALEVHVSWPDGSPAADVGLDASCAGDPAPREELVGSVTDEAGVARFPELHAGRVQLVADLRSWRTDGPYGRRAHTAEVGAGATQTIMLTLAEGLDVQGRVIAPDGQPVGGAEIWGRARCEDCPNEKLVTRCASDGTFRLGQIDGNEPFGARAPGFGPSIHFRARDLLVGEDGNASARTVVLQLGASGGRVRGRVLDPDGAPLAGARVIAGPQRGHLVDAPGGLRGESPGPAPVRTASNGSYALVDDLEPGTQPIHATAHGYPVWSGTVAVVRGQESSLEIRLERPARIEGRVLAIDGSPASGVGVIAAAEERGGSYWHPFPASESVSDEQGFFALDWITPGACELNAFDSMRPEIGRARASVNCTAGATTTCVLQLELGLTIGGRVVDESNVPLSGWQVDGEQRSWSPRHARTDAQGRFRLLNLGERPLNLVVRAPDADEHPRTQVDGVAIGTQDLVIVVADAHAAPGSVRGRVIASSERLADLSLILWKEGTNEGLSLGLDAETGVVQAQAIAGRYRLDIQLGTRSLLSTPIFAVQAGGFVDLGDLRIEEAGHVEIVLVGLPQSSLERIKLDLDRDGSSTLRLERDGEVFRSPELMPGRWNVSASSGDLCLRPPEVEVVSGQTTHVDLQVELAVRVAFVFSDPARGEFTIEAFGEGRRRLFRRIYLVPRGDKVTDERKISIGLPVGHATVQLRTQAGLTATAEVDVKPELAGAQPIELQLR